MKRKPKTPSPLPPPSLARVAGDARRALQKALDSERFIVFVAYAEDGQLHFGEHRHAFPTGDLNALAKKIDAEIEAAWLSASPAPIGKGR